MKRFWPGRRRAPQLIEHGEWSERTDRPRVLIENPDQADLWAHSGILRDAGYDVAVCTGPDEASCPLLVHGHCSLVEGADVIVSSTDLSQSRGILAAISRKRPAALVVEGPKNVLEREAEAIGGATVIALPVTNDRLLAAVADTLASRPAD